MIYEKPSSPPYQGGDNAGVVSAPRRGTTPPSLPLAGSGSAQGDQPGRPLPSRQAAVAFLCLVLLQGFHEVEHVVQIVQRYVGIGSGFFNNPKGAGILGSWLDVEPVHLGYNAVFLFLVGLCFWVGGFYKKDFIRRYPLPFGLMAFALLFEGYHFVEHIVKIVQFIETGKNGTPGILGNFFNLVWLHFAYNTIAYVPLLVVFFMDGYYRSAVGALSRPWRYKVL